MARQVVEYDQRIASLAHKILAHRRRGIGGNKLQTWRGIAAGDNYDGIFHCSATPQVGDDLGYRRTALPDSAVDADYVFAFLVQNAIHSDTGFTRLTIPQNQLALATAHRYESVHHLGSGLERHGDRIPIHDGGCFAFDARPPMRLKR